MDRRFFLLALGATGVWPFAAHGQEATDLVTEIDDLEYPPFDMIDPIKPFGTAEPTDKQKKRAKEIWSGAPTGPEPIDIARYFVDNYSDSPDDISQWPKSAAWNPLVVEFFQSTSYRAENDLVPWCAAFVNWCLKRCNRTASGSAASQSFLDERFFKRTMDPKVGDLAVFTCYSIDDGKSVGLGHVAFVDGKPSGSHVPVLGGNQANGGKSMICQRKYPLGPVKSSRTISGRKTPVIFKINTYISL